MSAAALLALLPLACLGLGAVAAMLAAAFAPRAAGAVAAVAHVAAAVLILSRLEAAPAASALLADDGLARAGALFASIVGLAILALPKASREGPALVALASAGAAAAAAATHAASLVLALETVTLATVALAAARRDPPAIEAAIKLLVPAGATGAAMLLGFALALATAGHLGLEAAPSAGAIGQLAAALLLFALLFKFALVPTHMWAPDLFEGGTTAAAAVAGLLSKAAVALVLLRFAGHLPVGHWWPGALAILGGLSFLLGGLLALRQTQFRRLLGWSSVAQSGLLAMLIGLAPPERVLLPLLFALSAYAAALLATLAAGRSPGRPSPPHALLPRTAAILGLVSLSGLPAAGGFVAKLLVLKELALASAWLAVATVILGSALGFVAYFRFVGRVLPGGADGEAGAGAGRDALASGLMLAASGAVLLLGFAPEPLAALVASLVPAPS